MLDQASQSGTVAASEIQPILESATFRKAVALRRLLAYLWENRHHGVAEYAIAVDALQRRADFDPRADATVRVHIARLRQKLKEYYESEGAGTTLVLTIPPGSYHLEIQERPATPETLPLAPAPNRWRGVAIAAILTALAAVGIAVSSHRTPAPPPLAPLPAVWNSFWGNGKPVKLVIPTPVFYSWPGSTLRARDVQVNDSQGYADSAPLRRLTELFGRPRVSPSYAVASDALGAVRLVQFLSSTGRSLEVAGAGDLSLELFGNHNLIIMGFPNASPHMRELQARTHFVTVDGRTVTNRKPAPGEPQTWSERWISEDRLAMPGLIAILPGQGPGTQLMLFSATRTAPLASFLISPAGAKAMDQVWVRNGSPAYFEVVVMTETSGNSLVKGTPVAFRAVSPNLWKQSVTVQ